MPAQNEATPAYRPGYVGGLDYDRGLVIKIASGWVDSRDKYGNPAKKLVDNLPVAMYKDEPGVYYAQNGRRLTEAIAKAAGFNVEQEGKKRKRAQFLRESAERFDEAEKVDHGRAILKDRDGIRLVNIGGDRHILEDANEEPPFNLTPGRHLTYEDALREFALFFDEEPEPPAPAKAEKKAPAFRTMEPKE